MIYYASAIFLSAFLLFQVQPLLGKYILPWFGGAPAVWSTTLLFFQALLTGGYAYTDWLTQRLDAKKQALVHSALVSATLLLLAFTAQWWRAPILPAATWQPRGVDTPVADILKILALAVGLPYFLLAANSPLMQVWFAREYPTRSPYRLYALSNIAALLALLTYPFFFEPLLTVQQHAQLWSLGWGVFALAVLYGARRARRHAVPPPAPPDGVGTRPAPKRFALWLTLSACASVLLLAITSEISQELAVIPFLWIVPLAIYLLTFILCFESERWYSRVIFTPAFFVCSALFTLIFGRIISVSLLLAIGAYALLLFVACMICHGELARLKPQPRHLTAFYLTISLGGALGGLTVNLLAPNVFTAYWELPLGLLACASLLLFVTWHYRLPNQTARVTRNLVTLIVGTLVLLSGLAVLYIKTTTFDPLFVARNFFGVVRVVETHADDPTQRAYLLAHGATSHGYQFTAPERRYWTTTYYTENSGGGLALLTHPKRPAALRVGILGLGIGVLSAYGQPGDVFRYYEINPVVARLAQGAGGYFDFVRASRAQTQIVLGDARIALEQELAAGQAQQFDLLVLDVFNSDSIPVHLVTREAFAVYLQHLQPEGILALHISNNFLDLAPVIWKIADELNWDAVLIKNPRGDARASPSIWMLATRDHAFLRQPAIAQRASPRSAPLTNFRVWTDDYSNLFQILK